MSMQRIAEYMVFSRTIDLKSEKERFLQLPNGGRAFRKPVTAAVSRPVISEFFTLRSV